MITNVRKMVVPGVVLLLFIWVGIALWQASGFIQPLLLFGYIGISLGVGLGLYATLPKKNKPIGRRITLFLVGIFLFFGAAILGSENMQIEGLFFGLLTGIIQAAVIHYLIAKIFGPLLFGRLWCGWACWTVMILDLLPFKRSSGRLLNNLGWVRSLHFVISLSAVLLAVFVFDYREGAAGRVAVFWFVVGNVLYYLIGIALAYRLKDNRAFCKYVCPVCIPLKLSSRFSLLKIGGKAEQCSNCGACSTSCPMDIRVFEYIQHEKRVLSTECTLCQTCITVCPQNVLKLSFGFDMGGTEYLRERS